MSNSKSKKKGTSKKRRNSPGSSGANQTAGDSRRAPAGEHASSRPSSSSNGLKVAKFGGSSLAASERIRQVADIVEQDPSRRFIVLSAPGKTERYKEKITDLLIACVKNRLSGKKAGHPLDTVIRRFRSICEELSLPESFHADLTRYLQKVVSNETAGKSAYCDSVKSLGEKLMAQIFSAYLKEVRKLPAQYIDPKEAELIVSEEYGDAFPLPETPGNLTRHLAGRSGISVIPGFFGITKAGTVATFARGGSDLTGALVAEAIDAEVYENWTDVDGIFRADPAIVKKPEVIHELTFREIRELSYMGFDVIHHDAILPVRRNHIPVNLRNVNNTDFAGTMIVDSRVPLDDVVIGVALKRGFCCFNLEKYLMNREVGFGRRLLSILEDYSLSYEHMPSGIDSVSVYLEQSQLREDKARRIIRRIYRELGAERVEIEHDKAMVIAVGEGMKHHVGVCARLVQALAADKINIEVINQGASELSILFGVREEDGEAAVEAIYRAFFGEKKKKK